MKERERAILWLTKNGEIRELIWLYIPTIKVSIVNIENLVMEETEEKGLCS